MNKSPNKLMFFNYSVDGRVTDIEETESKPDALIKFKRLSFNFFDKKQMCMAKVIFETDKFQVDLYKNALRFVKKLSYDKPKHE